MPLHIFITLSRLLQAADCGDVSVVFYLDDIVVYGSDPVCFRMETKVVLERLSSAGFMIDLAKSHFLVNEMKMLSYQLKGGWNLPSDKQLKVTVDTDYVPKSIQDVQHINGLLLSFNLFILQLV